MQSKQVDSSSKLRPFNADNNQNHNKLEQRMVILQSLRQLLSSHKTI